MEVDEVLSSPSGATIGLCHENCLREVISSIRPLVKSIGSARIMAIMFSTRGLSLLKNLL